MQAELSKLSFWLRDGHSHDTTKIKKSTISHTQYYHSPFLGQNALNQSRTTWILSSDKRGRNKYKRCLQIPFLAKILSISWHYTMKKCAIHNTHSWQGTFLFQIFLRQTRTTHIPSSDKGWKDYYSEHLQTLFFWPRYSQSHDTTK